MGVAEERLRLSIDAAPIGVAFVSTEGLFVRVNEALCRLLGYTTDELLALRFHDVTHPDDLAADIVQVNRVLDGELDGYTMEKRYLRRDGATVTVQLDVSLVRDPDGVPLHFISQIQDITDRKATLDVLMATEALQRASLNALEQGVVVMTVEGEIVLLNQAGQRILGYDAATLTHIQQSGAWVTCHEDGSPLAPEDRPLLHTLQTGEPITDRIIGWRGPSGLVTIRLATQPVYDEHGTMTAMVIAFADITQQRAVERAERDARARLEWQAFHDTLTRLPNRTYLLDRLAERLKVKDGASTGLLFLDLDGFKLVNDTMGHDAGDELLVAVAQRLQDAVRSDDLVARFGGDEFVILPRAVTTQHDAVRLAQRIMANLAAPIELSAGTVDASASIGVTVGRGSTADELLRDADTALYRSKQSGRGRYSVYPTAPHPDADDTAPPSISQTPATATATAI